MNIKAFTVLLALMLTAMTSLCFASSPEIWQKDGFDFSNVRALAFRQVQADDSITGGNEFVLRSLSFAIEQETSNLKELAAREAAASDYVFDVKVEKYNIESYWEAPYVSTVTRSLTDSWTRKRRDGSEEKITRTTYWEEPETHAGHFKFTGVVTMLITVYDNRTGQEVYRYYRTDDNDRRINSVRYITKEFCKKFRKTVKGE